MKKKTKPKMTTKFRVVNVVAVMNCGFPVTLEKIWKSPECIAVHDVGNIYTIVKPKGATKNVTIFYNGNMISVGNKFIAEARRNLEATKKYLKKYKSTNSFLLNKKVRKSQMGVRHR